MGKYKIKSVKGRNTLHLAGSLTIESAQDIKQSLLDMIRSKGNEFCISLDSVEAIDVSALQLLYAAWKEFKSNEKNICFDGEGAETLRAACTDAGFPDISKIAHKEVSP